MKSRIPIGSISALLSVLAYVIFTSLAYIKDPMEISPLRNWLSDLGNELSNPQGAIFYKVGVIVSALLIASWFTFGLSEWRLRGKMIQSRLLFIAQVSGVITAFALMMSALYPINHFKIHAFWSDLNLIMFGISFAFSVAALRYHPKFPKIHLFLGGLAAILPSLVLLSNTGSSGLP